jgi:hypothetical protein
MNGKTLIVRLVLACACMMPLFAHASGAAAMRPGLKTVEAQNEAAVLRFLYDGLNGRNFAVLSAVLSPNYVAHTPFGITVGIPAFEKVANN